MRISIKLAQKQTMKHGMKLITKIRLASFIQLGEKKFSEYVIELENDPVFKKLVSAENAEKRVITCRRFPKTAFNFGDLPFKEQLSKDSSPFDVETLLSEKSNTATLIKRMGLAKFEKYFLCSEEAGSVPEICRECGISKNDVVKILDLINDLSVRAEFYHPSELALGSRLSYAKIAEIQYDGKEDFIINFFSPKYLSGRYVINNARLNAMKELNVFSAEEIPRINKLIEKIELVNARKSTIYQIIRKIAQVQKNYIYSGEDKFLAPYTQKSLSQDIGIDDSVICRAIYGRSLVTPHGLEKPLRFFFPKNKDVRKKLIGNILSSERGKLTDKNIAQTLKDKFRIEVSRRTVNAYRNELQKRQGA